MTEIIHLYVRCVCLCVSAHIAFVILRDLERNYTRTTHTVKQVRSTSPCVVDGNAIGLRWPLIVVDEPKRTMSSRRRERGNFKFPSSRAIRNVWLWSIIRDKNFFVSWDYRGGSYAGKSCPFLQETNQKKVFTLVMPSSQHWSPTLSNLTKLGIIVHSIVLRSLICSYWRPKNSYSISSLSPSGKLRPHILPHVNMTTPTMFPWDKQSYTKKV